jgi:DNA-binding MurR/RpiR family transcriptional regulator
MTHGNTRPSIEAQIRGHYDALADSERPLADFILGVPGQVASYSATELAELAGVSKAAASRFVKKIGLANFEDMRRLAREGQVWGSPHYLNSPDLERRPFDEAVEAHITCETENIRATLAALPPVTAEIVTAMASARRVGCVGFRRSRIVADYLRWSLVQIRENVSLFPPPGETISEAVSEFGENDLIIAVGLRRRVPLLSAALRSLHARGVRIVLIADSTVGALADSATWVLPCESRSVSLFDSDIAAISVAHFLSSRLASELGATARARMQAVEQSLAALEELAE